MGFLLSLFLIACLLAGGYGWNAVQDLPPVSVLLQQNREATPLKKSSQVLANDGRTVILSNGRYRHQTLTLKQISPHFIKALLSTEDRRFYLHHGVDPIGIFRAAIRNIRSKGLREGASTITQQLARSLFLTNERSAKRKLRELWLAWQLEDELSKDEILARYLNTIYFGEGAYGIHAAAKIYFNKPASQLTLLEGAMLAGLPQAPSAYNPFHHPKLAKKRRAVVLRNLVEVGQITQAEADGLSQKPLGLHAPPNRLGLNDRAPFFNQQVRKKVMAWYGLSEQEFWQSGFKIYTTLDLRAQRLAERAIVKASKQYNRLAANNEAALVSLKAKTGAVMAYMGGRNFSRSQYDRAGDATRSPGSLFKVVTYAAAIESGYKPSDVFVDEPIRYGKWTPANYDKAHHGPMPLAQAFVLSNNIIAVKLLHLLGPPNVVSLAHRLGVVSDLKPFLSLTLGGSSVTVLDMTSVVATLVDQGVWHKPYWIESIVDRQGKLIYRHEPESKGAVSPTTANTMVNLMSGVTRYGTAKRALFGRPIGGKTGTSDEYRDAWFVGFTPSIVTGVWVGNDNNTPMPKVGRLPISGGTMPTELWKLYMASLLKHSAPEGFSIPHSHSISQAHFGVAGPSLFDASVLPRLEPFPSFPLGGSPGKPLSQPPQPQVPDPSLEGTRDPSLIGPAPRQGRYFSESPRTTGRSSFSSVPRFQQPPQSPSPVTALPTEAAAKPSIKERLKQLFNRPKQEQPAPVAPPSPI